MLNSNYTIGRIDAGPGKGTIRNVHLMPLIAVLFLLGCAGASLDRETARPEPSWARAAATTGPLAGIATEISVTHGAESSGFRLLDNSYDGLLWRLALIDTATTSLDIQTYLWYPDNAGRLVLERAVLAAERGVHVRLIIDDLMTIGQDQLIIELENHPNIEIRLFNPWGSRDVLGRAGELIAEMERLNTRMHDKLLIADGHAAIVGGRNIGDHYFGLSSAYNFHDLDLLGFGHIAEQSNGMFNAFWNSEWVESASSLTAEPDAEFAAKKRREIEEQNRSAAALSAFPRNPKNWSEELAAVRSELHIGTSELVYDEATADAVDQIVARRMFGFMAQAETELLITNAYIIPGQPAIDFVRGLTDRGVRVGILTNSLESHDVPAVNSHYKDWRDDFIKAGAELYEIRADAQIKDLVDVPPTRGEFVGLHTKAVVVDRTKVFVGSMNFDPRSFDINTEAGAFVTSPGLAESLARIMERDMLPENAWQVLLNENGEPYWVNSDETVYEQPARDTSQRVMDIIFKALPKEQY